MSATEKELDVTPEEIDKIKNALKDEKFREMFFDYCKEISDPENRAKYELEIQQLEKERGFDVTFVHPEAGHVIKAIDQTKNQKVFINVCTNANVEEAKVSKGTKKEGNELVNGQNWTVPHILNPPREDVDKAGNSCQVCDVMFHPDVYLRAKKFQQKEIMNLLNNIAIDASQNKFGFKLDPNNIKYPKLKYKGKVEKTLLRNKDQNEPDKKIDDHLSKFVKLPDVQQCEITSNGIKEVIHNGHHGSESESIQVNEKPGKTTPKYRILHRGHFDMQNFTLAGNSVISTRPAELCIEIELPAMSSVAGVDLDVFQKRLVLVSEKPRYHLDISLPYPVDEDLGKAQFDKSRKILVVTLPVIQPTLNGSTVLNDNVGMVSTVDLLSNEQSTDDDGDQEVPFQNDIERGNEEEPKFSPNSAVKPDCLNITGFGEESSSVQERKIADAFVEKSEFCDQTDNRNLYEISKQGRDIVNEILHQAKDAKDQTSMSENTCLLDEAVTSKRSGRSNHDRDENLMEIRTNGKSEAATDDVNDRKYDSDVIETKSSSSLGDKTPLIDADDNNHSATLEDINFDFGDVADLAGMTKMPPYDYDQNEDSVMLNINLPDVKIEDVSLGFSSRKAYFSMLAEDENKEPMRWCLLVKFPEYCCLDHELCSVDVDTKRLVLTLQKSEDSVGLWDKLYIGTNENNLEEMFFMTDHGMSELLSKMHKQPDVWTGCEKDRASSQLKQLSPSDVTSPEILERKLEQLLLDQERRGFVERDSGDSETGNGSDSHEHSRDSPTNYSEADCSMIGRLRGNGHKSSTREKSSSSSEMTVDVNLDELQNDVICDNDDPKRLTKEPFTRSCSDESEDPSYPRLRSILKRSKSESTDADFGSDVSDDSDHAAPLNPVAYRARSKSLNVDYNSRQRHPESRVRYKSVSFDPEPKVCEFVEYSKKQLKKMRKQERKQNEIAAKKLEAASKKGHGKNKGGRSGKNLNFFNGFRKDGTKTRGSVSETENDVEKSEKTALISQQCLNGEPLSDSSKGISKKPSRKSKKKNKGERKDERNMCVDDRTNSPSEQLTNSLIFELDD